MHGISALTCTMVVGFGLLLAVPAVIYIVNTTNVINLVPNTNQIVVSTHSDVYNVVSPHMEAKTDNF